MQNALRTYLRKRLAAFGYMLGAVVIALWRRPIAEELPTSVHLLVSSSSWHSGLLAAISFEFHSKKRWRLHIHEDGSVTQEQKAIICNVLPGARIISRMESDERMASFLSEFPKCETHRNRHNFFLKFFDLQAFVQTEKCIVLDSDVVFFRRPNEIIEWAKSEEKSCYYNEDTQEKYFSPRKDIEPALTFPLWPRFNSGLVLIPTSAFDLGLSEKILTEFEESAHHPQFFEQTLFCLTASALGKGGGLPKKYEINWGYLRSPGAVCRHYVGAFKYDLLYIEGASLLFLRLLPTLFKNVLRKSLSIVFSKSGIAAFLAVVVSS